MKSRIKKRKEKEMNHLIEVSLDRRKCIRLKEKNKYVVVKIRIIVQ